MTSKWIGLRDNVTSFIQGVQNAAVDGTGRLLTANGGGADGGDGSGPRGVDEHLCLIVAGLRPQVMANPLEISILAPDLRHIAALYKHTARTKLTDRDASDRLLMEVVGWFNTVTILEVTGTQDTGPSDIALVPLFPKVVSLTLRKVVVVCARGTEGVTTLKVCDGAQLCPTVEFTTLFPRLLELEVNKSAFGKLREWCGSTAVRVTIVDAPDITCFREFLEPPQVPLLTHIHVENCLLADSAFSPKHDRGVLGTFFYECVDLAVVGCSLGDWTYDALLGPSHMYFHNLVALDLSNNNLSHCDFLTNTSFTSLERISLCQNEISTIVGAVGVWLANVSSFRISRNSLVSWEDSVGTLSLLPKLTSVALAGNPIYDNGHNASDARSMFMGIFVFPNLERCSMFVLDDARLSFGETVMAKIATVVSAPSPPTRVVRRTVTKVVAKTKKVEMSPRSAPAMTSPGELPLTAALPVPNTLVDAATQHEEETKAPPVPPTAFAEAHTASLLRVVGSRLQGYSSHLVATPTSFGYADFADGIVLCALLHGCDRSWIDLPNLRRLSDPSSDDFENVRLAMAVAERELGLPPMMDPTVAGLENAAQTQQYVSAMLLAMFDRQAALLNSALVQSQLITRLQNEVERYRKQRGSDRNKIRGKALQRMRGVDQPHGSFGTVPSDITPRTATSPARSPPQSPL